MNTRLKPLQKSNRPRCLILLPSYFPHDAIGNEVALMANILREESWEVIIGCEQSHPSLAPVVLHWEKCFPGILDPSPDLVIYHHSIKTLMLPLLIKLAGTSCICLRYHNITPPALLTLRDLAPTRNACRIGQIQLLALQEISDFSLADSHFNAADLKELKFPAVHVCPILKDYTPFRRHAHSPRPDHGVQRLLFVGRIIPSKAQHSLLHLVANYRKKFAKPLQLHLVGSVQSQEYFATLQNLCAELGLSYNTTGDEASDVCFHLNIQDTTLQQLYQTTDVFVSMSTHEGFGVPLLEAMAAGIPVVALGRAAVSETVGEGGIICADETSMLDQLAEVLRREDLRKDLQAKGFKHLERFDLSYSRKHFSTLLWQSLKEPRPVP